jgi:hypothetical protein
MPDSKTEEYIRRRWTLPSLGRQLSVLASRETCFSLVKMYAVTSSHGPVRPRGAIGSCSVEICCADNSSVSPLTLQYAVQTSTSEKLGIPRLKVVAKDQAYRGGWS